MDSGVHYLKRLVGSVRYDGVDVEVAQRFYRRGIVDCPRVDADSDFVRSRDNLRVRENLPVVRVDSPRSEKARDVYKRQGMNSCQNRG